MNRRFTFGIGLIAVTAIGSATAFGQPTYINLGRVTGGDMARNGDIVVGSLLNSAIGDGENTIWRRGMGVEFVPGAFPQGPIFTSDDASVLSMSSENIDNWEGINCFLGNESSPLAEPCPLRDIAHRWTAGTGWENLGWFPRTEVMMDYSCNGAPPAPVTVWTGGTRCDFTINTVNEMSNDGRYVVGAGWIASAAPRSNGCAPTGICGTFRGYRYDAMTGMYELLAITPDTTASRADRVNGDGSLVIGYDQGPTPDPDGAGPLNAYTGRRLTVWRDGVETILDPFGSQDGAPSTPDGTQVLAQISRQSAEIEFGPNPDPVNNPLYIALAKWNWNGANWTVSELGRPDNITVDGILRPLVGLFATDVSDDGSTVVGTARFNHTVSPQTEIRRPFIWSPTTNGGVPMMLEDYIASQLPAGDASFDTITITGANRLSGDGRTILAGILDDKAPCLSTFGDVLIDLDGAPCAPPSINIPAFSPVRTSFTSFGHVINVFATGTGPLTYQWQKKDLFTAHWVDLQDDFCEAAQYSFRGSDSSQLRIGLWSCDENAGDYRCVVTNDCGNVMSNVVHVTIVQGATQGLCFIVPGDMNQDGIVDVFDVPDFVASILCQPFDPNNFFAVDRADVNLDGEKNGHDVQAILEAMLP